MEQIRRTGIGSDGQIVPPMFHTDEKVGLTTMTGSMIYNVDTNKIELIDGPAGKRPKLPNGKDITTAEAARAVFSVSGDFTEHDHPETVLREKQHRQTTPL